MTTPAAHHETDCELELERAFGLAWERFEASEVALAHARGWDLLEEHVAEIDALLTGGRWYRLSELERLDRIRRALELSRRSTPLLAP